MTKAFRILTIAWFLFMLCAPSCVDEQESALQEEALLMEEQARIRNAFEADYLDEASLFALEATATQKLYDLPDFIRILTDSSLDMSFRKKAGEMIQRSFLSDKVVVRLFQTGSDGGEEIEIQTLIRKGLNNELTNPLFSIDTLQVLEPLQRTGDATYSGDLRFVQVFTDSSGSGRQNYSVRKNAKIHVLKDIKAFGDDTLSIWSVRLGEIR